MTLMISTITVVEISICIEGFLSAINRSLFYAHKITRLIKIHSILPDRTEYFRNTDGFSPFGTSKSITNATHTKFL